MELIRRKYYISSLAIDCFPKLDLFDVKSPDEKLWSKRKHDSGTMHITAEEI